MGNNKKNQKKLIMVIGKRRRIQKRVEEVGKKEIGGIPKTMRDGVEDLHRVEEVGKKMNGVMEVEEEVDRVEEIITQVNGKTKNGNENGVEEVGRKVEVEVEEVGAKETANDGR